MLMSALSPHVANAYAYASQAKADKYRQDMERWAKHKPVVELMKSIGGWLSDKAQADGGYVVPTKRLVQQFLSYNQSLKDKWRDWLNYKDMDVVSITHKDATLEKLCDFVGDVVKTFLNNGVSMSWSGPPEGIQLGGASWYKLKAMDNGDERMAHAGMQSGNISGDESSSDGDEDDNGAED